MIIRPSSLFAVASLLLFGSLSQLHAGMMGASMSVDVEYVNGPGPTWANVTTQNFTVIEGLEFLLPWGFQLDVTDTTITLDFLPTAFDSPVPIRFLFTGPSGIFTGLQVSSNNFPAPPDGTNVLDVTETQAVFNATYSSDPGAYTAVLTLPSEVPEPGTSVLTGAIGAALFLASRRRRSA